LSFLSRQWKQYCPICSKSVVVLVAMFEQEDGWLIRSLLEASISQSIKDKERLDILGGINEINYYG